MDKLPVIEGDPEVEIVYDSRLNQLPVIKVEVDQNSSVIITDDGRTFEAPKENPTCPICNKVYQVCPTLVENRLVI